MISKVAYMFILIALAIIGSTTPVAACEENEKPKEDKNQSKCNPSDYRGDKKHRDDCKPVAVKPVTPEPKPEPKPQPVKPVAAVVPTETVKTPVEAAPVAPVELPKTGIGVMSAALPLGAGIAAYAVALKRRV